MKDEVQAERTERFARGATRWVAPPGKKIPRTRHGLLDSETLSRDWYSGDRPDRANSLVGVERSYVLLAPGGAGKTTLVEELKSREPHSASVDLRMHSRDSLASVIRSVSADARSVFVDALDEALQLDPNLGYMLVKLLGEEDARGVAWRLACRPGSWTLDLAEVLRAALPDFEELELLPLDLRGVEEIAGPDAEVFLEAVDRARLTRQLAQPLNARALLEQWRSTGVLPATRSEAMRHTVGRLLEEAGAFRQPRRQDDRRMALVAERLAAITMLCGVGRFALGPGVPAPFPSVPGAARPGAGPDFPDDAAAIAFTAVPVDEEPDLAGAPLTVDDLREVLGTSLFSAAGEGSVAFLHQSYAEFLAAAFLTRRGVTGRRLVSVLGADVNGLAPGPMIEVLGWMLALGANVPAELIGENAKPLLSTAGLELADERTRERVVDALLRGAANGTVHEGWGLDTSILSHPGLGARLHEAAHGATNPWEIFWIARIARHCVVLEAADDLLAIARDASWPAFMRAEAAQSFAAMAPVDRMGELDPLLKLDAGEDPQDEILAAALRAVLRGALDIDRVAAVLRPPRRPTFVGDYSMLLGELPTLIRDRDALPLLKEALTRNQDTDDSAYGRMVAGLLARVWETADPDAISELGALIGRDGLMQEASQRADSLPWDADERPELRRTMASAALATGGHSFYPVLELRILTPGDLAWLIDWMAQAPAGALESAGVVLGHLTWAVADVESADRILSVSEPHPAHTALSAFQGSVGLDARPEWVRMKIEGDKGRPGREQLLGILRDAIASAQEELGTWWNSVVALAGDWVVAGHNSLFTWDLTARPLWTELEPVEQQEFWRLAMEYVATRQPEPTRWVGRDQWNLDDAMPDWAAVFALATAAAHRPEVLAGLPPAVWETWAPVIVATPPFTGVETWQPVLRRAAPASARAALTAAVRELVRSRDTTSFAHHQLADFADPDLLDTVAEVARDPQQQRERRDEALGILVGHAPATALEVARSAQNEQDPPDGVAEVLATLSPEELLAPRLAAGALGPLAPLSRIDLDRLSGGTLADLARMLLDELPFANDPDRGDRFTRTTPESEARRVRVHVLQAMAARGMAGQLEKLVADRAEADVEQIRHMLQQAREREALRCWRPLDLDTMMKLVAQGDARLVRDSASLVTVLLEQLEQVQRDLRERAAYRSLWNGEPGTEGAAPKVEDDISDWLAQQLELRLSPHVVVDREIQVTRPKRGGIGTRIDITVTSPGGVRLGRVPFEAKRAENRSLLTALDDQLVGQYMEPADLAHGIYIVYWVDPALRPSTWSGSHRDPVALTMTLREQAQRHRPRRHIDVVVLDIGPRV
jgi:hypothetical protein